jgi:hypothetical protein
MSESDSDEDFFVSKKKAVVRPNLKLTQNSSTSANAAAAGSKPGTPAKPSASTVSNHTDQPSSSQNVTANANAVESQSANSSLAEETSEFALSAEEAKSLLKGAKKTLQKRARKGLVSQSFADRLIQDSLLGNNHMNANRKQPVAAHLEETYDDLDGEEEEANSQSQSQQDASKTQVQPQPSPAKQRRLGAASATSNHGNISSSTGTTAGGYSSYQQPAMEFDFNTALLMRKLEEQRNMLANVNYVARIAKAVSMASTADQVEEPVADTGRSKTARIIRGSYKFKRNEEWAVNIPGYGIFPCHEPRALSFIAADELSQSADAAAGGASSSTNSNSNSGKAGNSGPSDEKEDAATIALVVKISEKDRINVTVKRSGPLAKLRYAIAVKRGIPADEFHRVILKFDGEKVDDRATPEDLDMDDEDQFDCIILDAISDEGKRKCAAVVAELGLAEVAAAAAAPVPTPIVVRPAVLNVPIVDKDDAAEVYAIVRHIDMAKNQPAAEVPQ